MIKVILTIALGAAPTPHVKEGWRPPVVVLGPRTTITVKPDALWILEKLRDVK